MDTITQIALGAAVGEAVLGRTVHNKALFWGGLLGTLPDLDVIVNPFVSEVQALAIHRGPTHSLLFAVAAAPLTGLLLARLYPKEAAPWHAWGRLAFWVYLTHSLLDCFTTYGTQIFWPFSTYPASFNSIFIIDPFYTLPLLGGLLALLFRRQGAARRRINYAGLTLSSLYLLFTLLNKHGVEAAFEASLQHQGIAYQRLLTTPTALNNLLWMGIVDDGSTLRVGLYSILDDPGRTITFRRIDKHRERLAPYADQLPIRRLLWFSRAYYTVTEREGVLFFHDLRFGRTDGWLTEAGDYVFTFELLEDPQQPGRLRGFRQCRPTFDLEGGLVERFVERIRGR